MLAEKVRAVHIETGERHAASAHMDGEPNRLETAVTSVVDHARVRREPLTLRTFHQADAKQLGNLRLVVAPGAFVGRPFLAGEPSSATVEIPPTRVACVKDLRTRHQAPGVIYRDERNA